MSDFVRLFERLYARAPDGVPAADLADAERRMGCAIPGALRAFYSACGGEACVMATHERVYEPSALTFREGRIVFCEENQGACVWACRPDGHDGVEARTLGRDGTFAWHPERGSLRRFLDALVFLQTAWGGFVHVGELPKIVMPEIEAHWDCVVWQRGVRVFWRSGSLIVALDGSDVLTASANTAEDFERLAKELGAVRL